MIRFKDILNEVRIRFPEFVITKDIEDLPAVLFSFLAGYLINSLKEKNIKNIDSFVDFINGVVDSKRDSIVDACLDEIFIDFYSEAKDEYAEFVNMLSPKAREFFYLTINMWDSGNNNRTDNV